MDNDSINRVIAKKIKELEDDRKTIKGMHPVLSLRQIAIAENAIAYTIDHLYSVVDEIIK